MRGNNSGESDQGAWKKRKYIQVGAGHLLHSSYGGSHYTLLSVYNYIEEIILSADIFHSFIHSLSPCRSRVLLSRSWILTLPFLCFHILYLAEAFPLTFFFQLATIITSYSDHNIHNLLSCCERKRNASKEMNKKEIKTKRSDLLMPTKWKLHVITCTYFTLTLIESRVSNDFSFKFSCFSVILYIVLHFHNKLCETTISVLFPFWSISRFWRNTDFSVRPSLSGAGYYILYRYIANFVRKINNASDVIN